MTKVNVTCRMDDDRVAGLDRLGEYYDRDRSYLINEAVERYLSYHQWQLDEVDKAIAEANAGELLSEKEFDVEMKKWRK